jgi:hypothetical protein
MKNFQITLGKLILIFAFPIFFSACQSDLSINTTSTSESILTIEESTVITEIATKEVSVLEMPTTIPVTVIAEEIIEFDAIVFRDDPVVPIITFHQFAPDYAEYSTNTKTRFSDFQHQLQTLYENDYTLISFEDWLAGDMTVLPGKRPLIFSMDDLFFNNQIRLSPDKIPKEDSGIGILWRFYQENPDFGFSMVMFTNLGDKLYGNPDNPDWEKELGETIAWSIDHDLKVYNHTYLHKRLDLTPPHAMIEDLTRNDNYLIYLLDLVDRGDLVPTLGNMVGLPFGTWPESEIGKQKLMEYISPNNVPIQAIFEIDYIFRPKFLPPIYSPEFDRFHIQRMVGNQDAVDYLVDNKETFPVAENCYFSIPKHENQEILDTLLSELSETVRVFNCSTGIYLIENWVFEVSTDGTILLLELDSGM